MAYMALGLIPSPAIDGKQVPNQYQLSFAEHLSIDN